MTEETFRSVFPKVEALLEQDETLKEVEWEFIGGEITKMPYEFWERNLPWAIKQVKRINKTLSIPGSINFLTNLFLRDDRYIDLFNSIGQEDIFCLYTSWEPDTGRFGKNQHLFPKWKKNVERITAKNKILDVILTKKVIELGPEYLVEHFVPLGITDFSCKMISPYGSGRSFWQPNMVSFDRISDYLIKLGTLLPSSVTFTPKEEMLGSLYAGTSYQCVGNFLYDIAIEPDGLTTFNASQVADEAVEGCEQLYITDTLWPVKTMFNNTSELYNKMVTPHEACSQCEYHHYCGGGWYHYRICDKTDLHPWNKIDCPGYKKMWDVVASTVPRHDRTDALHKAKKVDLWAQIANPKQPAALDVMRESQLSPSSINTYLEIIVDLADSDFMVDRHIVHGKPLIQRLWFYESLPFSTLCLDEAVYQQLCPDTQEEFLHHCVYDNLKKVLINPSWVYAFVDNHADTRLGRLLLILEQSIYDCGRADLMISNEDAPIIDARNEELVRWIILNPRIEGTKVSVSSTLAKGEQLYLETVHLNIEKENSLQLVISARAGSSA